MSLFELEIVGGPFAKRLASRRQSVEGLPWGQLPEATPAAVEASRWVWTQSAFSEYASAAAFADIAAAMMAAGAPIDMSATAADFVIDELFHAELSARLATLLGGAVPLDVDLERLVRPASCPSPVLRAAELLIRTSCVGETLTVAVLDAARRQAEPLVAGVISRILRDEAEHATLGFWFIDWASPRLSADDRAHLARVACDTITSFSPLFSSSCDRASALGVLTCDSFDRAFSSSVERHVIAPLAQRGIDVASCR